jgi:hypothetical protein
MYEFHETPTGWVICWGPLPREQAPPEATGDNEDVAFTEGWILRFPERGTEYPPGSCIPNPDRAA